VKNFLTVLFFVVTGLMIVIKGQSDSAKFEDQQAILADLKMLKEDKICIQMAEAKLRQDGLFIGSFQLKADKDELFFHQLKKQTDLQMLKRHLNKISQDEDIQPDYDSST
jgi:hypothetical protein